MMTPDYISLQKHEISQRTFRFDLLRGGFRGVLATGANTFCLFIAIRYFHANDTVKSLIAAAPFLGMFASFLMVHYVSKTGLRKSVCGAIPALVTGISLLLAAWVDSLAMFTFFVVLAYVNLNAMSPFLTSIYSDNYPEDRLAAFYSKPLLMTVAVSVLFGFAASSLLDLNLNYYRLIFVVLGLCGLGKAWALLAMPSKTIETASYNNPFANFKYVFQDRSFGYVLLTYFLMGFANLWVQPLRVDYLTSGAYGIQGSALLVAALTTIIPDAMRIVSIPFWAHLFDRMNFIVMRMILNVLFAFGLALFFFTDHPAVIAGGAALIGVAFGGGSIAWNLWITRYAPPGKAASYMSVHVSLTGVRGTLGPMIGFWTVNRIGPANIGFLSFGLMIVAALMLIPEIKRDGARSLRAARGNDKLGRTVPCTE